MNLLDLTPNLWRAIARGSLHGSIALIAVFLACRLIPRLPASAKSWLWRLAWLRVIIAFVSASSVNIPVLPAAKPAPVYATFKFPSPPAEDIKPASQTFATTPLPRSTPDYLLTDYLTVLWLLGVLLMLARLAYHYRSVCRLRCDATRSDQDVVDQLHALCIELNLREPALLISSKITKPLLTGLRKPAIILPPSVLSLTEGNIELILKHELAHLKRRDLAWNSLGALAHILLWFNPLTWLCERESHFAQEAACDQIALRNQTNRTSEFAGLLVEIAAKRERAPQLLTVSMIRTANTLERRLKAMKTIHHKGTRPILATIIVAAALTPALIPWRASAQKPDPVPAAPATASADGNGGVEATPTVNKVSEEEKLLNEEIVIARKDLEAVSRAKESGRASPEEVIAKKREVQKLERELAVLHNDPAWIRQSLKEEISDVEKLQLWAAKKIEVGAASPEDKSKIDREVLRLKRELAALDREKPNEKPKADSPQSMMYYMSNPELMKRDFPQMYAMMTNKGRGFATNLANARQPFAAEANKATAQESFQDRLNRATRENRPLIQLQPRRPGVVTFVNVKPGEYVEAGHMLVRLDDREAQIKLRGAQSEYEIAQADNALKKKEATSKLNFMTSQANANAPGVDEYKKSNQEEYDLKVKKLDSELRLASIKVDQAKLEVDERTIPAPVAGVVGSVPSPGQSLNETSVAVEFLADPPK
jgi:beta-lactamase regulating signal transducer with metallopeptidase domain